MNYLKTLLFSVVACILLNTALFSQVNNKAIVQNDSIFAVSKGCPVVFNSDTLFYMKAKSGSFSPSERASAISARIKNIAETLYFSKDSLKITTEENYSDISYGETVIVSVNDKDAIIAGSSTLALSENYKGIIGSSIERQRHSTSIKTILFDIGLILIVIIAVYWIIKYINKLFRFTKSKIIRWKGKYITGFKIRDYELLTAKSQLKALLVLNNIIRWFILILLVYLSLPVIFNILPWTKGIADTLFGFVLNPLKSMFLALWHYLPNLITIIVIVFVFRYVLKGLHFLKNEIEKEALRIPGFYPDWANPTYQIIRVMIFAFLLIVIFPYLPGSDSPVFQGVSVFLGVLFTFGSSGSLSNIIAGLVLTYMRSFKIGDRVKIGEITGDIVGKTLLVTRIRTIKNEDITIPNSTIMNSHTVNYSSSALDRGLIVHSTVTIGYDVPWKDMHQALIDAALRTEHILHEPLPFVLQTSLDDFYISYQINAYTREPNKQSTIYSNLHQNIQDVCNERGIEILSPHYRAARDGNATTIPNQYLSPDYKAPGFNIHVKNDTAK
jgi:small-conductance mechanosensitive channel